jgi:hypothetical protein
MFHDLTARTVAQLSAATLSLVLIACAGTKINTPGVETNGTKIGSGSVEVASENKQPASEAKPKPVEAKPNGIQQCPHCQRIDDRIAEDESALKDPATVREWKTMIVKEMRFLKQERERCWVDDCGTSSSHRPATDDAKSRTYSRGSSQ